MNRMARGMLDGRAHSRDERSIGSSNRRVYRLGAFDEGSTCKRGAKSVLRVLASEEEGWHEEDVRWER